jgi:hypothetical protein
MGKALVVDKREQPFDYGELAKSDIGALEKHAEAVHKVEYDVRKRTAEGVLSVGHQLSQARERLAGKGRDGMFRKWVKDRCGFTPRTAYHAIDAYTTFGGNKCETVSHLLTATAMYYLVRDDVCEETTDEVLKIAEEHSVTITQAFAKALVFLRQEGDASDAKRNKAIAELIDLIKSGVPLTKTKYEDIGARYGIMTPIDVLPIDDAANAVLKRLRKYIDTTLNTSANMSREQMAMLLRSLAEEVVHDE